MTDPSHQTGLLDRRGNLLLELRKRRLFLNPAQKKVADFLIRNPKKAKTLRITELASECSVSEGTITKFVRDIGLKSFQDLRITLTEITLQDSRKEETEIVYEDISRHDSIGAIIDKVVYSNIVAFQNTQKIINKKDVERAVNAISSAAVIDIYGSGGSHIAAESARLRLYRIGMRCCAYEDSNQQLVSASLLTSKDAAIGISNSGSTLTVVRALMKAKESGATTICITNSAGSPITRVSDIALYTSTQDSAFFQESTASRLAQLLIVDFLYAGLAVKNFERSIKLIGRSAETLKQTHAL